MFKKLIIQKIIKQFLKVVLPMLIAAALSYGVGSGRISPEVKVLVEEITGALIAPVVESVDEYDLTL